MKGKTMVESNRFVDVLVYTYECEQIVNKTEIYFQLIVCLAKE